MTSSSGPDFPVNAAPPEAARRGLQLAGWVLMFAAVPSRHLLFNADVPSGLLARRKG